MMFRIAATPRSSFIARSGTSRVILSRIVTELESVPAHGLRAPVVVPKPGIWELAADLFCAVARVVGHDVMNQMSKLIKKWSLTDEGRAAYSILLPLRELVEAGQLEEARPLLDAAIEAILTMKKLSGQDDAIDELLKSISDLREGVDLDLHHISQAQIATTSIVVLAVSEADSGRLTLEGCPPSLLHNKSRRVPPGFANATWVRTRECLAIFCGKYPGNDRARMWHDKVSHFFSSGEGEGGVRHRCRWTSERRVTLGHDDGDDGRSGDDMYLSIILAAKHDDSAFCQQPQDHCLDRLRAFLVTSLHLLAANDLAAASEILFVEYNPLTTASEAYLQLSDVIPLLVDPLPARTPVIRVLTITRAQHDTFYNPAGLEFLEFHAKNVAAVRSVLAQSEGTISLCLDGSPRLRRLLCFSHPFMSV